MDTNTIRINWGLTDTPPEVIPGSKESGLLNTLWHVLNEYDYLKSIGEYGCPFCAVMKSECEQMAKEMRELLKK